MKTGQTGLSSFPSVFLTLKVLKLSGLLFSRTIRGIPFREDAELLKTLQKDAELHLCCFPKLPSSDLKHVCCWKGTAYSTSAV